MDPSFPNFHQQSNNPSQQNLDMQTNFPMHPNFPTPSFFRPMYGMPYQGNMNFMPYGQTPQTYGYAGMPNVGMHTPNMRITNYPGYYMPEIPEVVGDDSSGHHEAETRPTQRARGSRSYNSWSTEHNKLLLNGWLRYTNDSVTGTAQSTWSQ